MTIMILILRPTILFLLIFMGLTTVRGDAHAESRVALVIGNNDYAYEALPDLNNAARDASDLAKSLEKMGFEVILQIDATELEMGRAIRRFANRAREAEVGLVYYSGHGIQHQGINWLVPTDAHVEMAEDLETQAFDSTVLLEALAGARTKMNIVILDACRNNPLPVKDRKSASGLTRQSLPSDIQDTAIIFSASDGGVAQDGPPGENSVFTNEFLKLIDTPGLRLDDLFKRTAKRVADITGNSQAPMYYSNSRSDFYFIPEAVARDDDTTQAGAVDREALFWESIKDSRSKAELQAYLKQYPEGTFAPLAKARIKSLESKPARVQTAEEDPEINLWKAIRESEDPAAFQDYLQKYPAGTFAGLAKARLADLTTAAILATNKSHNPDLPTVPSLSGGVLREAAAPKTPKTAPKPAQPEPNDTEPKPSAQQRDKPQAVAQSQLAPTIYVVPTRSAVNLRRNAKGGSKIGVLKRDQKAVVLGKSPDDYWYHVKLPSGQTGYVYRGIVREEKGPQSQQAGAAPKSEPAAKAERTAAAQPGPQDNADAQYITPRYNKSVNVRRSETGGARVGLFERGTQARVLGRSDDKKWYKIALPDGQTGYVYHTRVRELNPGELKR